MLTTIASHLMPMDVSGSNTAHIGDSRRCGFNIFLSHFDVYPCSSFLDVDLTVVTVSLERRGDLERRALPLSTNFALAAGDNFLGARGIDILFLSISYSRPPKLFVLIGFSPSFFSR